MKKNILTLLLILTSSYIFAQELTLENLNFLFTKSEQEINKFLILKGWTLSSSENSNVIWHFNLSNNKQLAFGLNTSKHKNESIVYCFDNEKTLQKFLAKLTKFNLKHVKSKKLDCGYLDIYRNKNYNLKIMYTNKNEGCNLTNKFQIIVFKL